MKKIILFIIIIILAILFFNRVKIKDYLFTFEKEELPVALDYNQINDLAQEDIIINQQKDDNISTPVVENGSFEGKNDSQPDIIKEVNLAVPFMVQAPDGNWELPYQEACEEAAIIMVHYYLQNKKLDSQIADQEIKKLVDWQVKNKGDYKDTTVAQTAEIIKAYWGYEVEIIKKPTVDIIKKYLLQGLPVIAPFYGRAIGNPYYTGDGPLYHMMVIKGFKDNKFITNDPGTKRGEDYIYDINNLMLAMHDWNDGDVINGQATALIIKKK